MMKEINKWPWDTTTFYKTFFEIARSSSCWHEKNIFWSWFSNTNQHAKRRNYLINTVDFAVTNYDIQLKYKAPR